jgi:hypothetical protein
MPVGSSFQISLTAVLIGPDDPQTVYAPGGAPFCTVPIAAADAGFPRLYTAAFNANAANPIGAYMKATLTSQYGSQTGLASLTMAVDVMLRTA